MPKCLVTVIGATIFWGGVSAYADCAAPVIILEDYGDNPIFEVVSCDPAEQHVESLRELRPERYGSVSYSDQEFVLTVIGANRDAQMLMRGDTEHWYYASGCSGIAKGMRLTKPEKRALCCDVGPVRTFPCAAGGIELLRIEGAQ